jgi:hypothetical protein
MPFAREGDCSRCGACCWGDLPEGGPLDDVRHTATIEGACPLLRCDEHDGFYCAGWGWHPYYLAGCNVWPQHPSNVSDRPGCAYTFTEV